jgi:hypothetical protein
MQTAAGFIKFQGKNSVLKGKILINMDFDTDIGLNTTISTCEEKAISLLFDYF